jgi:uncharacterized RDD family membrane protein YckC
VEHFEDRLTLATPEGVELEVTLAGLASRGMAGSIDLMVKAVAIGALALLLVLTLGEVGFAILIVSGFFVIFFYDVLFETLGRGRTLGKRWIGLRVLRDSGRPVDWRSSAVRNLLRLVDGLPLFYAPTIVSILVTRRNQRLGDLAAGTVVVRERHAAAAHAGAGLVPPPPDALAAGWDVSAVGQREIAAVHSFLVRRHALEPGARARLARQLEEALRVRVGGADEPDPERFLERLASAKAARERP